MTRHEGSCFCGAVRFTVSGEPAAMGYSSRMWCNKCGGHLFLPSEMAGSGVALAE